MNFPRFWAQGNSNGFSSWRWSDTSHEEAQAAAQTAAQQLEQRFRIHGRETHLYGYSDRPLREPVLHELRYPDGTLSAVVTRNAYGCDVLNAAHAMFVDIDTEPNDGEAQSIGAMLGSIFGPKHEAPWSDRLNAAFSRAHQWAMSQPGWNWRVYRTRAGVRLLATHALFDSKDPFCQTMFQSVQADPLYQRLCDAQQCFRARMTPKPWRCDIQAPPARWPFADAQAEHRFEEWQARYRAASSPYATCQLMPDIGSGVVIEALHPILSLHDSVSRASSGLPLA